MNSKTGLMGLVVDLNLCIGCYACEFACRQEKRLAEGIDGIRVFTIGPYEWEGRLAMDFLPQATDECDLCSSRTESSERPFCAEVCPTQALSLLPGEKILNMLQTRNRVQVCKTVGPVKGAVPEKALRHG
jgi:Fe-S-cluster-containing dehydrogenase component